MLLADVNVLVYAHRTDSEHHTACRRWLETCLAGEARFACSDLVLSGFVRIVTHPRVFVRPTPLARALEFAGQVRDAPNAVLVQPSDTHWSIFARLCAESGAKGNLVPDAYLAALAIEHGCEWVTLDRDYSRFKGLRWSSPPG